VLPSAPYIVDEFHNCVNNIDETLNHVKNKKKFYENLLKLQEYLIEQKFYDREPLGEIVYLKEDGSALYSTDNAMGQDNFPVHNNIDTSPLIRNDLDANRDKNNEDLEYHNVVGDATKDQYMLDERQLSSMAGSSTVEVKQKCRLAGNGNTSTACNQGDIRNLNIKPLKEEISAKEAYTDEGALKTVLNGKRKIGFVHINKPIAQKLEKLKIGVIPVRMTSQNTMTAIIYRDKVKAYLLYEIAKKHGGYLNDRTPEEAREIGRLLEYKEEDINEFIHKNYGVIPDKSPDDFNDLAENASLDFWDLNEGNFPAFEKDIQQDLTTHQLDKKYIRSYQDGEHTYNVYAVNGDQVRDSGFIEWVDGGNHWVDADLPKKEQKYAKHIGENDYWIDDVFMVKPADFEAILLHERTESFIIRHYGYEYDDAHEIANKVELMFRKKIPEGANRALAEKIYDIFVANFKPEKSKQKHKPVNESIADVAAEKQFGIQHPDTDFETQFSKEQNIENKEEIIYITSNDRSYSNVAMIKNPKSWRNIGNSVRGVIDSTGNLYIELVSKLIHEDIINELSRLNLIKYQSDWDKKLPESFITVQRHRKTNNIFLGESTSTMYPDEFRPKTNYWQEIPSNNFAKPVIQKFLDKAKQKNPYINFINETIYEYYKKNKEEDIFENEILNEGQIMALNYLPFKEDVEEAGGKIYSVGGAVRDEILGKESKDLDILITGVPFEKLEEILSKYGAVNAVGKSFGILKFKPKGATEDIDIAIPRTETPTGEGGHQGFDVKSNHALPIEKDLERRDFTINAIAKDAEGNIVDPFGGQEDLKNKVIKVVNPQAFSDDPLRMLRAVQFASRFGFTIDPDTMKMIQENAGRVKEIAPERILTEFEKIVRKCNILTGAILLNETGLLKEIFGRGLNYDFRNTREPFDKVRTMGEFVYLLSKNLVNNPAEFYKNNLKGDENSYKEIKALQLAYESGEATNLIEARSIAHNMYVTSPTSLQSQILPNVIKTAAQELFEGKYPKTVNELAVNGNDLMELGLQGKAVGDMQKSLLLKIYSNKVMNNKEDLLSLAGQNGK
jgi:tRNA nucleotidyltransferase/poly(A) polymerase